MWDATGRAGRPNCRWELRFCVYPPSCLWQPPPSRPGDESGPGRRAGDRTEERGDISAPPAGPVRTEGAGFAARHGGSPGILPLSSAFRRALPASLPRALPGRALPRTERPGIAGDGFLIPSVPPCPGLAQRCRSSGSWRRASGRLCPSALSHPAETLGRGHGESPALAAPPVLPQGRGLAEPRCCPKAAAPSRGETGPEHSPHPAGTGATGKG